MQESFWHKFGQNPLSGYWDIVIFMFCAIFSNSSHLGIPNCKKIQRIHTRNILAQRWINFKQWVLRYCRFRVYAIFTNSPWRSSWLVNLHKYEIVPFRDRCDQIWTKYIHVFSRYWHLSKIGLVNTKQVTVTLLCCFFFFFHNFDYKVPLMFQSNL